MRLAPPSCYVSYFLSAIYSLFTATFLFAENTTIKFDDFPFLKTAAIRAIHQDRSGYIWIGTAKGLHRYDGHKMVDYPLETSRKGPLSDYWITCICEDKEGFIWVGTNKQGLFRFDPMIDHLISPLPVMHAQMMHIDLIFEDSKQGLWIGTHGGGIFRYNRDSKDFEHFIETTRGQDAYSEGAGGAILEGRDGTIWIGGMMGLYRFNQDSEELTTVQAIKHVNSLGEDREGKIWVCNGDNIFVVDPKSNEVRLEKEKGGEGTFLKLVVDRENMVWCILGESGGLGKLDPMSHRFTNYKNDPSVPHSLSFDTVHALYEDKSGILWVGTTKGLNKKVSSKQVFQGINNLGETDKRLPANVVRAVVEDKSGLIWASTSQGVVTINLETGFIKSLPETELVKFQSNIIRDMNGGPDDMVSWSDNHGLVLFDFDNVDASQFFESETPIHQFCFDGKRSFWLGAEGGLYHLDLSGDGSMDFVTTPAIKQRLENSRVAKLRTVTLDSIGRVWYGMEQGGVQWYDPENARHSQYDPEMLDDGSSAYESEISVTTVFQDSGETFWVGTLSGLVRYEEKTHSFVHVENLQDVNIRGILEDEHGLLWISSYDGLYSLEKNTSRVSHFNAEDGLLNYRFLPESGTRLSDGRLMFGGLDGIDLFDPSQVVPVSYDAPLVFSSIKIDDEKTHLGNHLTHPESVVLPYGRNRLEADFALLNYANPNAHHYRHYLVGYDEQRKPSSKESKAQYMNLPPGEYSLVVESVHPDGEVKKSVSLGVVVVTPYWQRIWFLFAMAFAVSGVVATVYKIRIRVIKQQKILLENEVQERTQELRNAQASLVASKEKAEHATQAKSQFLANMSHEIRTPLNGIVGLTELALGTQLNAETQKYMQGINDSADSLLNIVDDLLDLSRIEAGKLSVRPVSFRLRDYVCDLLHQQTIRMHQKDVELVLHVQPDLPDALIGDKTRFAQIFTNLIGNAIKFTQEGEIYIRIKEVSRTTLTVQLQFSIADTGLGIPKQKQDLIFNAFEQVDASSTRKYGGAGLGLAISKQLAEMLQGELSVESPNPYRRDDDPGGPGSVFHFTATFDLDSNATDALPDFRQGGHGRILIVVAHAVHDAALTHYLRELKLNPVSVGSGQEALNAISQSQRHEKLYDVILIDDRIRDMDACRLTQRIRQMGVRTPLVLTTSMGRGGVPDSGMNQDIDGFLQKPVKPYDLFKTINDLIGAQFREATLQRNEHLDFEQDASGKLKVLIAEDDEIARQVVRSHLEKWGHTVTVAKDGLEAVQYAGEHSFDLILMDLHMPGKDGVAACKTIRNRDKQRHDRPTIIAMTAAAMQEDRDKCLAAGMDGFIAKPLKSEVLRQVLCTCAEKRTRPSEHGLNQVSASRSDGVFDREALMCEFEGNQEKIETMVEMFQRLASEQLELLKKAIAARDKEEIFTVSHKLKNYFADFHALEAVRVVQRIEKKSRDGDLKGLEKMLVEVENAFTELSNALVEEIGRNDT